MFIKLTLMAGFARRTETTESWPFLQAVISAVQPPKFAQLISRFGFSLRISFTSSTLPRSAASWKAYSFSSIALGCSSKRKEKRKQEKTRENKRKQGKIQEGKEEKPRKTMMSFVVYEAGGRVKVMWAASWVKVEETTGRRRQGRPVASTGAGGAAPHPENFPPR